MPDSYADEQYYGIDAFVFINAAGQRQAFRYIIAPERIVHLSKEEAAKQLPDYLIDELAQRLGAVVAEAAGVGRGVRARGQTFEKPARRLIGEHDDVELLLEPTGAHHGIHERHVGHLPRVEHPAGPALVHRGVVGAVQAHARRFPFREAPIPRRRARRRDRR